LDLDLAAQELCERGRRPLASSERRCKTASSGALRLGRRGAPFTAGITPERREAHGELNVEDAGAAATTQDGGRRPGAAKQVRRPCLGDGEHSGESKQHLRVPYLAVEPRASLTVAEEQRTGRLTAAEEQRTGRLTAAAALGLGGGPARARARVLGEGGGALNRSPGCLGVRARSHTRAHGWLGVGSLPRSVSDPRSGMTGGARSSAAEAGGRGAGPR
jgi:hypothetical protein